MIIRWMGAFGYNIDLVQAIEHELSLVNSSCIKCAESIKKGTPSEMRSHVQVGLLVRGSAVVRRFKSDVYSIRLKNGKLGKTRYEGDAYSTHTEVWVRPDYTGIVLRAGGFPLSREVIREIFLITDKYNIPLFKLSRKGELDEVIFKEDRYYAKLR